MNLFGLSFILWCFLRFLNCTNDTKSRKASHMTHSDYMDVLALMGKHFDCHPGPF